MKALNSQRLEWELASHIESLYLNQLGHQPHSVTCKLFDTKLAIVIDSSITKPEQLLKSVGRVELLGIFRAKIEEIIHPRLRKLIESIIHTRIVELLANTNLKTEHSSMIAILATEPQFTSDQNIGLNQNTKSAEGSSQ